MSKHYIIDGYNAMHKLFLCEDNNLQKGRERLAALINKYKLAGSSVNKIAVVFDGVKDPFNLGENAETGVIFSQDESADSKIKKMVENSKDPRNMVVVTDDNEIKFYTRGLGAEVKSVGEFFAKCKQKSGARKNDKMNEYDRNYSEVTEELKKLWIKK